MPLARVEAVIEPLYPSAGRVGRYPIGVSRMYCLQQWFGLSDEGPEDAMYDSQAMRGFIGIDLVRESVPEATTRLKLRRLLETNQLTEAIVREFNAHLRERELPLREGTMVDATIIESPSSAKKTAQARDAKRHKARKGKAWHLRKKAQVGADADSGLVQSGHATAADESDVAHV